MNFKIFSVYDEKYEKLAELQKQVFNKFNLEIHQRKLLGKNYTENYNAHGRVLSEIISNEKQDLFIFFDVDCFPLKDSFLNTLIKKVEDGRTLSGAVGCANHIDKNNLYVHPCFIGITKEVFEKAGRPGLSVNDRNDTGQFLTKKCKENNLKIDYWLPTSCKREKWDLLPLNLKFGHGTVFEESIYHQFELAKDHRCLEEAINKCKEILS